MNIQKLWPKEVLDKKWECLYCKEKIMVMCGTPLIHLSGCCYGYDYKNTKYIFGRKAHIKCWLKENKLKIIDLRNKLMKEVQK